jgi:hypothetical protein
MSVFSVDIGVQRTFRFALQAKKQRDRTLCDMDGCSAAGLLSARKDPLHLLHPVSANLPKP